MLELLIGNIAAGKSTYAMTRAKHGAIIVNDDAIVTALHGGNYLLYTSGLKPLYKHVENSIITMALSFGRDVIVDRPNGSRLTRARYIGLARSLDAPVRGVLFEKQVAAVHAKRRFNHDARGYTLAQWEAVAKRYDTNYETPQMDEGFDGIVWPAQALELAHDRSDDTTEA